MSTGTIEDPADRSLKYRASLASLLSNLCVTLLKIVAAVLTGSISLLSESIHSATDVLVSTVTFICVRAAQAPPDEEHPYGHGKIESLAGFAESILLGLTVAYIFYEATQRLVHGSEVRHLEVGIWIMGISAAVSLVVGGYIRRAAERTESTALKVNGRHQIVDFVTSSGVLVALAVTRATGWKQADAYFAMALAVWIAFNAVTLSREAIEQLIDRRVSDDEIERIRQILAAEPDLISYHRLRTRHSGHVHYIDVHVVVPNRWSVVQAHSVADRLEKRFEQALQPAQAVVHIDPYDLSKDRLTAWQKPPTDGDSA